LDGSGFKLGIQSGYARFWGDPLIQEENEWIYSHPRRPISYNIPIKEKEEIIFTTPFGGPIYLKFKFKSDELNDRKVVRLRIKGAAKYGYFDFTKPMSDADIREAYEAIKANNFGWQTSKFVGGEVTQTNAYAIDAIGINRNDTQENGVLLSKKYVLNALRGEIIESNHVALGYNDMPMSDNVKSICSVLDWRCDGDAHTPPGIQRFIGWMAICGSACSGDPIDSYMPIKSDWTSWHEMGHNTVQRVHRMMPSGKAGCDTECDNNILSTASAIRKYALTGDDSGDEDSVKGHRDLYLMLQGLRVDNPSEITLRKRMQNKLWDERKPGEELGNERAMRAFHYQLAFLYTRFRLGLANPTPLTTIDFLTLIAKGDRLVQQKWTPENSAKYGMGRYDSNSITNHDLLYVLSSKIVGKDLRKYFSAYGLPLDQRSLDSISDLKLNVLPLNFYALDPESKTRVETGKWVDIEMTMPGGIYDQDSPTSRSGKKVKGCQPSMTKSGTGQVSADPNQKLYAQRTSSVKI